MSQNHVQPIPYTDDDEIHASFDYRDIYKDQILEGQTAEQFQNSPVGKDFTKHIENLFTMHVKQAINESPSHREACAALQHVLHYIGSKITVAEVAREQLYLKDDTIQDEDY